MKILTISIAAYNASEYVEKTLESLVNNDFLSDLEIIVVDDGSIDETAVIVQKYVEMYPSSVRLISKENGGYGSTINCSVKEATGKYFKLLDADDWLDSKGLQHFIHFLSKTDVDIILCDYCRYYENSGSEEYVKINNSENQILPIRNLHEFNLNPSMTVKTSVLQTKQYTITEKCMYTDLEFCANAILNSNTFIYIPLKLYCYRIGRQGQSISLEQRVNHIYDHSKMVRKTALMILSHEEYNTLWRAVHIMLIGHIISYSLYVKPNLNNLREFIDYCEFIKEFAPEAENIMNNRIRMVYKYPKGFYLPICFKNRFYQKLYHIKKAIIRSDNE